ncbi:hypothetical protein MACK_001271 [Theileria orientalis]|uniref:Uncharacterized protein n=1 Tax=Theileria orientalis TaxID=68886 RepID=A0A976QVH7_THEOR|nr:hypothetical protein MACK_001271 [Theileria orientalis]
MRLLNGLFRIPQQFPKRFRHDQIRRLGQAPQGNNVDNLESAWEEAKRFFYRPSYSYQEFAKRVECVRLFLFWGLVTGLAADLVFRPLKTNYWFNFNFKDRFKTKEPPTLPPLNENHMTDASMEYNRICNF